MTFTGKTFSWVELVALFIGIPIFLYFFNKIHIPKSIPLLIAFLFTLTYLLRSKSFSKKSFGLNEYKSWKQFGIRIGISLIAITLLSITFLPQDRLFYLPINNFKLWALIMIFYPLWSAFTQEVIYRGYYFHRYLKLFKSENTAIAVNGLLFGLLHIIFRNWIAVIGATVIGLIWAYTYFKHRSIIIVSIEHAIVGNYLFTIGLGYYFYVPDF